MGQNAILGGGSLPDAIANFNKKFKDKSGLNWAQRNDPPKPKKYTFIERSYENDSDNEDDGDDAKEDDDEEWVPPESKLEQSIQDLMALIFNMKYMNAAMADLNYDAKKMPLGKLSKSTILKGFQALKDLASLFDDNSLAQSVHGMAYRPAVEMLSNRFYSYIPHDFGRNRPPVIDNELTLKREIELLESLGDMKEAAAIMKAERPKDTIHVYDRQFSSLGMEEMTVLDRQSTEFKELAAYLVSSKGATHNVNYEVEDIFRIERAGETKRFDESVYPTIPSDRRLLWHGSRATNFGGILSQGLRIAPPEAPVSGYMVSLPVLAVLTPVRQGHLPRGHVVQVGQLLLPVPLRQNRAAPPLRGRARRPAAEAHQRIVQRRRHGQGGRHVLNLGPGPGRPLQVEVCRRGARVAQGRQDGG